MTDKHEQNEPPGTIAPGYPEIAALQDLDVSGWEPAAIFKPVSLPDAGANSGEEEDNEGGGA